MPDPTPTSPPPLPSAHDAAALSPEQERQLRQRGLLDLSSRTAPGVFIYPVAWLVVSQGGGFMRTHQGFVLANAAGLLLIAVLRFLLHRRYPAVVEQRLAWATVAFRTLCLVQCLHWGILLALSIGWEAAAVIRPYMIPMSVALIMAGCIVVSIEPFLARVYPPTAIAPVLVALALDLSVANALFVVLGTGFMLYAWTISGLLRRDYWAAQRARALLEVRARELELVSLTDALTQVPNRLYLDRRLPVEWLEARRQKHPLAALLVDLDHFKRINDTRGHPCGDQCLREAASRLRSRLLRPSDTLARYGGEEFVVLLPNTDLAGAQAVAERLREHIAARPVTYEGQPVALTCSVGVCAVVPASARGAAGLLRRADEALYRAKAEGRNRVVALPFEPEA